MGDRTTKALEDLQAINTTLGKVSVESANSLQKIKELEEAAANNDTPQEVLDKIAEVKTAVTAVDDLVPDPPAEPPVEG